MPASAAGAINVTIADSPAPPQVTLTATGASEFVEVTGFTPSPGDNTTQFTSAEQFTTAESDCSLSMSNTVVTCVHVDSVFYVFLGAGSDTFEVDPTSDQLHAAVFGGQDHDTISGGQGSDMLRGGGGDDVIDGEAGDDD